MSRGFDTQLLKEYEAEGLIRSQLDHTGKLRIYNYTEAAAYGSVWDAVTMACRGLIQCDDEIVARPFKKFFNLQELPKDIIPWQDPYLVQDKLDGSMIIVAHYPQGGHQNDFIVATRGSFQSEQALHAREILEDTYADWRPPKGWTALFEILYPANRIVVDYGNTDDLVLIGAVKNHDGEDWPLANLDEFGWPGTIVTRMAVNLGEIQRLTEDPENGSNREGFVIVWPVEGAPSFRVKVKFAQYVMLHKIVTGLSTTSIWEALSNDQFQELLEVVPDEWFDTVRKVAGQIVDEFNKIADEAESNLTQVPDADRKVQAEIVKGLPNPGLLFAMLDGKDTTEKIWKMVKPVWTPLVPIHEDDADV